MAFLFERKVTNSTSTIPYNFYLPLGHYMQLKSESSDPQNIWSVGGKAISKLINFHELLLFQANNLVRSFFNRKMLMWLALVLTTAT